MDEFVRIYNENCEKDRQLMREMMSTLSRDFQAGVDRLVALNRLQVEIMEQEQEQVEVDEERRT